MRVAPALWRHGQHEVAVVQLGKAGGVQAVVGQFGRKHQLQATSPRIDDGAGQGDLLLFAAPVKARATPVGALQLQRFADQVARQGQAQGLDEILVADDAQLLAGRAVGDVFQGLPGVIGLAAEAIQLTQIETVQAAVFFADQP